jgi:hypothetical protein
MSRRSPKAAREARDRAVRAESDPAADETPGARAAPSLLPERAPSGAAM